MVLGKVKGHTSFCPYATGSHVNTSSGMGQPQPLAYFLKEYAHMVPLFYRFWIVRISMTISGGRGSWFVWAVSIVLVLFEMVYGSGSIVEEVLVRVELLNSFFPVWGICVSRRR